MDSVAQWREAEASSNDLSLVDGLAEPTGKQARFRSVVKMYESRRRPDRIVFEQSPAWDNWRPIPNVGPENTRNAPVFLPVGEGDYWYFAEKRGGSGYHVWHSSDLQEWTHHGMVTESRWMTTAEYADGMFYLYYDQPNDEDPHLVIDEDLTDGERRDIGEVFADPSHGSDAGILRDADGSFHLIYEDWSPINARAHSWDSPLAGHAESPDGVKGFEPHEHTPPIDERTVPLPESGTYNHPATGDHTYHKHKGPQDAFGDYTLIRVGPRYYLFCDYDPHGRGRWLSRLFPRQGGRQAPPSETFVILGPRSGTEGVSGRHVRV